MLNDISMGNIVSITTGVGTRLNPSVAAWEDGRWVVVYDSFTAVHGAIFAGIDPAAVTSFLVATAGSREATHSAAVVITPDERFTVAWNVEGYLSTTRGRDIEFRAYAADGSIDYGISRQWMQALSPMSSRDGEPELVALPSNEVVVVSDVTLQAGAGRTYSDIVQQRISDGGGASPGTFVASPSHELLPDVAARSDGTYLVTWTEIPGETAYTSDVFGRVYDAEGMAQGDSFALNTTTSGAQFGSRVAALADGNFAVVWLDIGLRSLDTATAELKVQIVDSAGNMVGAETLIADGQQGAQGQEVVALSDGRFVVLWENNAAVTTTYKTNSLQGQVLNADGSPASDVFEISHASGSHFSVTATELADGRLLVSWSYSVNLNLPSPSANVLARTIDLRDAPIVIGGTARDDSYVGSAFGDTLSGGAGDDTILGGAGDDVLAGGAGDDTLDGGSTSGEAETDRVVFTGTLDDYRLQHAFGVWTLQDTREPGINDGRDTVSNFEEFEFADGVRSLADMASLMPEARDDRFSFQENHLTDGRKSFSGGLFNDNGAAADNANAGQTVSITHINGQAVTLDERGFVTHTLPSGASLAIDPATGNFSLSFGDRYDDLPTGASTIHSFTYTIANDHGLTSTASATFVISGIDSNDGFTGTDSADTIRAGIGNDVVNGLGGNDTLYGGTDNDKLFGDAGDDTLKGDSGLDVLTGGAGKDTLTGGASRDIFDFNSVFETRTFGRDKITDFQRKVDDIDLSTIDANSRKGGNQAFKFIGETAFTNTAGELHTRQVGSKTYVEGDVNGDGRADFAIEVNGTSDLVKGDFIL